ALLQVTPTDRRPAELDGRRGQPLRPIADVHRHRVNPGRQSRAPALLAPPDEVGEGVAVEASGLRGQRLHAGEAAARWGVKIRRGQACKPKSETIGPLRRLSEQSFPPLS